MYLPVHSINYWISTIAKIPSTEQDGGINVMSMGRNGSSLAWMTTTTDDEYVRYYFYGGYSLQDDDLYARVCKKGDVAYIRV